MSPKEQSTEIGAEVTFQRAEAIDLVRGIVMLLMALDHTRDFFTNVTFDPLDLAKTTPALFLTRWITHFCAPVFVFLAGTGAYFYGARGKTKKQLSFFLLTRGLWLVVLEFTLVHFGWFFNFDYPLLIGQVIWAIGWSMVVLAVLVYLPVWAIASIGIALVACHNSIDYFTINGPAPRWLVAAQLRPGFLFGKLGSGEGPALLIAYPVLPWLGIMACGYGLGALWLNYPRNRRFWLALLGLGTVLLFVGLRWLNGYGDPQRWSRQSESWATVLSFLNCTKYPPSLLYALMTLGPALLLLAAFDRPAGKVGRICITFGRVPLFFYLLHVPLIHLAALGAAYVRYGHAGFLLDHPLLLGRPQFPSGYGYGLPVVYLVWIAIVVSLYPLCRWFERVKRTRRSPWLSYL
jgi:uncharacterized membrane protein